MKKVLTIAFAIVCSVMMMAQEQHATKPTIMVVPSDNWCLRFGYTQTYDNQGQEVVVSDYAKALREDTRLSMAIHKIEELMTDRGFPLKNMEQVLKNLSSQSAEDAMLTSKTGAAVAESPIDKLKKTAKADIIIYLNWKAIVMGAKVNVHYDMAAIDVYTGNNVATSQGASTPQTGDEISILQQCANNNIGPFVDQLSAFFEDMMVKGRQISVRIKAWDDFEDGLEAEYDGKELSEIIEGWMTDNCVEGRNHLSDATENMMYFDEVRIPLFDESGRATDARKWVNNLRKYLKSTYDIEAKLMMQGLGQAQLVIGGK